MNVQIVEAAREDEPRLAALYEYYAYELSDVLSMDVGEDGRFHAPPLELYWSDPRRHPFLVRVDDQIAGFALIQRRSRLTGDESINDVAEFFVLKRHRRHGVGEQLARALFDRFRGRWEVRGRKENVAAAAFWRRVIGRYTDGRYEEIDMDDERWRGPVQRFENPFT
jgi:predicted acetyltransferase